MYVPFPHALDVQFNFVVDCTTPVYDNTHWESTTKMPLVFESRDVIRLVGISPVYLNKFVERGLYGIAPSERTGAGRGRRRLFTSEDVFGIALVWWLFEAGQYATSPLRTAGMSFDLYEKPTPAFYRKSIRKQVTVYFSTRQQRHCGKTDRTLW